jgi:hypothetical protein
MAKVFLFEQRTQTACQGFFMVAESAPKVGTHSYYETFIEESSSYFAIWAATKKFNAA